MTPETKLSCVTCFGTRDVVQPAHIATFMGRTFEVGAKQVACPACSVVIVRGVRTHQTTAQVRIVPVTIECRWETELTLAITDGGVTGYESLYFDDHVLDGCRANGWPACVGTPGRYDSLFIPAKEMRAAFEKLRLV